MKKIDVANLIPKGYRILVKLPKTEEKSQGGIYMTHKETQEKIYGIFTGEYIKGGESAFGKSTALGEAPKEGQMIMFARHAGEIFLAEDGYHYRLMNDEDITATL